MKNHPVTHENGGVDTRYSVEKEFTGRAKPQFVARFCGEFIGSSGFYNSAVVRCIGHNSARKGNLVVVEQR
jgi:hypothetical protein